nr:transcriptional regulatory protein [Kwoniella dejecticola CBS 10117]OBR87416.1 transcriptional regulatory protein [Kwoniella dejecticola CBS 10117]
MRPPPLPLPQAGAASGSNEGAAKPANGGVKQLNGTKGEKEKNGRQSFSCAECRRLKLKCSREWPCTSCEKRGCAQICPNGEMRTGKGKRLILADTAELHQRISLLEVALAQSHAKHSSTPHPLLESPYLFSPRESSSRPYPRPAIKEEGHLSPGGDDLVEGAFGTLTIGEEGQAKFVGSFAGSEYLRDDEGSEEEGSSPLMTSDVQLRTPSHINHNGSFPPSLITPPATANADRSQPPPSNGHRNESVSLQPDLFACGDRQTRSLEQLRTELPDYNNEGRFLVESYWENVNWQYQPIPKAMFGNDHLVNAYDSTITPNAHKMACVFFVMAIGAMFDLNRQPFHPRGDQLFQLGRSCINARGLENASPATIQALHLMGTYILNDKHGNGAELFWPIIGTAVKVAQSLGLHRDGTSFGLSSYEVEERRQVWWELVTYDRLQALCFGRPCATSNKWADAKMPEASDLIGDDDGFHRAKYTLISMMERVIDIQTQASSTSPYAITQLDNELRDYKRNLPEQLLPNVAIQDLPLDSSVDPHLVIHRLGIRLQLAQMRLLLNRPLFAKALKENPDDPSRAKLGQTFVALFESAQEIVQLVKILVIYHPSLVARWWFFWFHAFSSAVCLAAIVIRAPTCAFASPSFHGMSIVCDIAHAAREGCRAKKGLPILIRLRKRAHEALSAAGKSQNIPINSGLTTEEDDLSHLAGSAKLKRVQTSLHKRSSSSPGHNGLNGETTPSPQSGSSIATSATLAEPVMHEGMVPTFPGDFSIQGLPYLIHPPMQNMGAWVPEDPMNQYINSSVSPPMSMSSFMTNNNGTMIDLNQNQQYPQMHEQRQVRGQGQAQSPTSVYTDQPGSVGSQNLNGSSVFYGNNSSPEYVDMDMSMALGMRYSLNNGMPLGMDTIGNPNDPTNVDSVQQHNVTSNPNRMNFNDNSNDVYRQVQENQGVFLNSNGDGRHQVLHGNGNIMFGQPTGNEGEVFGFNFEDFVNQMSGG